MDHGYFISPSLPMEQSSVQIKFFVLLGLFLAVGSLLVIDRYYYSWTGVILSKIGFCECKTISQNDNGWGGKKLSFRIDIEKVKAHLSSNPNYELGYRNDKGYYLSLSRTFGSVKYFLVLNNLNYRLENVTAINAHTEVNSAWLGEDCTIPYRTIEKRLETIIADLPLSNDEKKELLNSISIHSQANFRLPLP